MEYLFLRKKKISYTTLMKLAFPTTTLAIITSSLGDKELLEETSNRFNHVRDPENFIHDDTFPAIIGRIGEYINLTWLKLKNIFDGNEVKILRVVVYILVVLFIILAIVIILLLVKRSPQQICLTPSCVKSAYYTLKYMDISVEPCTDFYEFACGKFIKDTIVEPPKVRVNSFSITDHIVKDQLKSLILDPLPTNLSRPYHLFKTMRNLCYSNDIRKEGVQTIEKILKQLGDWPLMEGSKWNTNSFDWAQMIIKLKNFGLPYSHFFSIDVDYLPYNTSEYSIIFKTNEIKSSIKVSNHLNNIVRLLNLNSTMANEDIKDVMLFKEKLEKIFNKNDKFHDFLNDIVSLNKVVKNINWITFFKNLLKRSEEEVTQESSPVEITSGLMEVLLLLNVTNKRIQANYVFFETVIWMFHYADDHLRYIAQQISNSRNPPRWYQCIDDMLKSLNLPLYSLYAKKYFNNDSKMAVEELIGNVRLQLLKLIKSSVWLDSTTKENAIEKAMSMVAYVGYPNQLEEPGVLDIYYEKLNIDDGSYLKSIMLINNFNGIKKFDKLLQPTKETKWTRHTDTTFINAYYMPIQNCIDITVAILNEPFFNNDRPPFMNYARVGMVIGHEMMHGFDNTGMQFDKDGNYIDWWSDESKKIFQQKAQCIAKQYSNYTFPGLHMKIDGVHTLGENIADNIGLQLSHLAYKTWIKNNGPVEKLPGLNYTQDQLFWVSFAQGWCEKLIDPYYANLLDVHSPPRCRVIGTLSNNKEFAKDFKCPKNSDMNPSKKCNFW